MTRKPLLTKEELAARRKQIKPTTIGARVRELREAMGLTRRELSRQAGLSIAYVSFIESGRYANPRLASLLKLSVILKERLVP